jgi:hypothetical protein
MNSEMTEPEPDGNCQKIDDLAYDIKSTLEALKAGMLLKSA